MVKTLKILLRHKLLIKDKNYFIIMKDQNNESNHKVVIGQKAKILISHALGTKI